MTASMRIIRLNEVIGLTGLARSTVYKYVTDGGFPQSVTLGPRCVGWVESEIRAWVLSKIEARDAANKERNARKR